MGVCLFFNDENCAEPLDCFYVIPLDSYTVRECRFDDFIPHEHIPLPLARVVNPDVLDETMRKDYFNFVEFLNSQE